MRVLAQHSKKLGVSSKNLGITAGPHGLSTNWATSRARKGAALVRSAWGRGPWWTWDPSTGECRHTLAAHSGAMVDRAVEAFARVGKRHELI